MIFVDSSFWIALFSHRETHHDAAAALFTEWGSRGLVTTNHVEGETWTFLRRRAGHGAAFEFADTLERSRRTRVIFVGEASERDAWRWLRRHDERKYSLVDATSFVVMKANKIRQALAFDGDFTAAGFTELRP